MGPAITPLTWMCRGTESNRRHADFQSTALPTELPRPCTTSCIAQGRLPVKAQGLRVLLGQIEAGPPQDLGEAQPPPGNSPKRECLGSEGMARNRISLSLDPWGKCLQHLRPWQELRSGFAKSLWGAPPGNQRKTLLCNLCFWVSQPRSP